MPKTIPTAAMKDVAKKIKKMEYEHEIRSKMEKDVKAGYDATVKQALADKAKYDKAHPKWYDDPDWNNAFKAGAAAMKSEAEAYKTSERTKRLQAVKRRAKKLSK